MKGFCPKGVLSQRGFVPEGFCPRGFCPRGVLSYTLLLYIYSYRDFTNKPKYAMHVVSAPVIGPIHIFY